MTLLGADIEQARARFGWRGLLDFVQNIPPDSATFAAVNPEHATRNAQAQGLELLACVFDAVSWLQHNLARHWGAHPERPKPYPLPWRDDGRRRIGRGAVTVAEFEKWYYGEG